eukprot:7912_1
MSWQWIDEVFQLRLFLKLATFKDEEQLLLPYTHRYLFPNLARFVEGQFKPMEYNKPFKKWKKPVMHDEENNDTLLDQSELYHDTSDLPQITSVSQLGKSSNVASNNLPCVGSDDKLLERVAKLFLIAHKNKSPLIDKETRRFIASAVIDRYLYDQQHQEKYDDDLNEKLEELFKELQEKRLPIDLTNEPDECVSDIDMLE